MSKTWRPGTLADFDSDESEVFYYSKSGKSSELDLPDLDSELYYSASDFDLGSGVEPPDRVWPPTHTHQF